MVKYTKDNIVGITFIAGETETYTIKKIDENCIFLNKKSNSTEFKSNSIKDALKHLNEATTWRVIEQSNQELQILLW